MTFCDNIKHLKTPKKAKLKNLETQQNSVFIIVIFIAFQSEPNQTKASKKRKKLPLTLKQSWNPTVTSIILGLPFHYSSSWTLNY